MVNVNDIKNGMTVEDEGSVFQVVEFQHVKPGKGAAFVKMKLRNLRTGSIIEKTYNSSVKLAVKDTDTVEDLVALEKMGVHVLECGICVNYFDLKDQLGVGSITNMFRITELMRTSQRVVKP